jgi:hypothetical protein
MANACSSAAKMSSTFALIHSGDPDRSRWPQLVDVGDERRGQNVAHAQGIGPEGSAADGASNLRVCLIEC